MKEFVLNTLFLLAVALVIVWFSMQLQKAYHNMTHEYYHVQTSRCQHLVKAANPMEAVTFVTEDESCGEYVSVTEI